MTSCSHSEYLNDASVTAEFLTYVGSASVSRCLQLLSKVHKPGFNPADYTLVRLKTKDSGWADFLRLGYLFPKREEGTIEGSKDILDLVRRSHDEHPAGCHICASDSEDSASDGEDGVSDRGDSVSD